MPISKTCYDIFYLNFPIGLHIKFIKNTLKQNNIIPKPNIIRTANPYYNKNPFYSSNIFYYKIYYDVKFVNLYIHNLYNYNINVKFSFTNFLHFIFTYY